MGIRILILHPPWKKMNPDPGPGVMNISLKFAGFFFKQKKNFQNIFLLFMIFIPAIQNIFITSQQFRFWCWEQILFFTSLGWYFAPKCWGSNRSKVARSVLNISSKNIFSFFLPFDFPQYPPQKTLQITIFHLKKNIINKKHILTSSEQIKFSKRSTGRYLEDSRL